MESSNVITKSAPTSGETVWAFDLGKGSIGEAVRQGTNFLQKASLLIPADFAETKTAANRRRAWRTRQAHKAREQWLEQIWSAAGLEVLRGRQIRRDEKTNKWLDPIQGDERLEREFAKDGDDTCYTSCLLRIKLLREEKLEPWQIYKALRSAIQKRGYDDVKKLPWAGKEARRAGKSIEELEKEEEGKDENYVAARNRWRDFKAAVPADFHFPCFYDASKMGLWNAGQPDKLSTQLKHEAESTRNVRFDREDVEREIKALASQAEAQLKTLAQRFRQIQREGWMQADRVNGSKKHIPVSDKTLGDFLCHGPVGIAYASYLPKQREEANLHMGSNDDWMGALGQKIPRFDNRILNDCILIPRFHVCKAEIREDAKAGKPIPDSLLPAEVTFLMKLKNTLVAGANGQRKLTVE
jgi:CRISPR-associated endonuclease Csn1